MAEEITLAAFERNAKSINKKGMLRDFTAFVTHSSEYTIHPPLTATPKVVLEVTVDKSVVEDLMKYFAEKNFTVLGSMNYYFYEQAVLQFFGNRRAYPRVNPQAIEAIAKDLPNMKQKSAEEKYKEIENEDCIFYVVPFNDGVETLFEFIKLCKEDLLKFAKDNDVTLMMKIAAYTQQLNGFFSFNFFDADKGEENAVIDYASRITVGVNFKNRETIYNAGVLLNGLGKNEEELKDEDVNVHIVTQRLVVKDEGSVIEEI